MKHKDLMDLNLYERQNCITFLKEKTKYNTDKYKYPFPLNQLTAISYRIKDTIRKTIEEIPELEQVLKTTKVHTRAELESTLYEDLTSLKKQLTSIKEIIDLESTPLMQPIHTIQELEILPTKKLTDLKKKLQIIKDIREVEQEKQITPSHTKKELENMTEEALKKIRTKLRRIKVVQIELALPETVKKAKEIIKEQTDEFEESKDYVFITEEEGYTMFGEEYSQYTNEELEGMGYKRELGYGLHGKTKEERLKDEIRDQLITFISQLDKESNIEDLYLLSLNELRYIYESLTKHLETLPTYEDITMSAKMGL